MGSFVRNYFIPFILRFRVILHHPPGNVHKIPPQDRVKKLWQNCCAKISLFSKTFFNFVWQILSVEVIKNHLCKRKRISNLQNTVCNIFQSVKFSSKIRLSIMSVHFRPNHYINYLKSILVFTNFRPASYKHRSGS